MEREEVKIHISTITARGDNRRIVAILTWQNIMLMMSWDQCQ